MTTSSTQPTVVTPVNWLASPRQGEWTYDAYAALPDDGRRYEILDGVLLLMTSAPTPQHQRVGFRIAKLLSHFIDDTNLGEVFIAPLDVELASKTVVQPDVFVLLKNNTARITAKRIQGVPNLVVEVSSPGTVGHDRAGKQQAYQKAGVQEYWFVDPLAHTIEVLALQDSMYTSLGVFSEGRALTSVVIPALEQQQLATEQFFR